MVLKLKAHGLFYSKLQILVAWNIVQNQEYFEFTEFSIIAGQNPALKFEKIRKDFHEVNG